MSKKKGSLFLVKLAIGSAVPLISAKGLDQDESQITLQLPPPPVTLAMMKTALTLSLVLCAMTLISGCNDDNTAASNAPAPETEAGQSQPDHEMTDQWVGRWIGVEGLFLEVSQDDSAGPGHYLLEMQYGLDADQHGTFEGQATDDGISFSRDDGQQRLRAGDGEATGLKWLAEKEDCLVVQAGEGYCRD
ncbi:hypothetical protein ACT3TY_14295 [Halomonas sp. AOP22-C1-8]|uniref:hypothetical protein n=1 Tax=Halomonas sp. AOP22-C1-8 TaxID=3457717 RepID=UPI004034D472